MIHVFLGTKAQLIKTAPVIRRLDAEGVPYRLIDSGQHADLSQALRRELGVREPDARLRRGRAIATVSEGSRWLARLVLWATCRPHDVRRRLFGDHGGICLIHGDTASTLAALYLAKRAGLRVAHLEAGLRSYSFWHPFPEELIRVITMRGADLLFAPSEWAYQNLRRMRLRGKCVNLGVNTNVEAARASLERPSSVEVPSEPYVLVTIHRLETIYHRRRLRLVVDLVRACAQERLTLFVLHEPTRRQLARRGWLAELEAFPRIRLLPLLPHHDFLHLLRRAECLITDGGSIQEESAYLGVPTLVLRRRTERQEGLTTNVRLAPFDLEGARRLLRDYRSLRGTADPLASEPSRKVVEYLRLMDGAPSDAVPVARIARATGFRSWIWTLVGLAAIGIVLASRWSAVPPVPWRWHPWHLAASMALLVASFEWAAWLWWRLLVRSGVAAPHHRAVAIWFKTLPIKYLPGGIWSTIGRLDLCRMEGWSAGAVSVSLVLEQLSSLMAAVLVASVWLSTGRWWWVGTIGCVAAALVAARPERLVALLTRRLVGGQRSCGAMTTVAPVALSRLWLGYVGYWLLHGAAFALFLSALVPVSWEVVPTAIGAFAGSFIIGYLVLFAPAGLGVREGALATMLSARWPAGTALLASVLARVWIVAGELLGIVAHGLWGRRRR